MNEIKAIDPNKYLEITEESFIKKYGQAAEKLLIKVKKESYNKGYHEGSISGYGSGGCTMGRGGNDLV